MKHIINTTNYHHQAIGSKAYNMFRMRELELNVPDFFCINNFVSDEDYYMLTTEVEKSISLIDYTNDRSIDEYSNEIVQQIHSLSVYSEIKEEILLYLEQNFKNVQKFSVRSSSSIEDGSSASFAGQFKSFLNIDKLDLFTYIIKCFSSLYESNVLKYAHENNISILNLKMTVIIQEMIDADLSGVIFSSNPQGLISEMVIVIGEGTGDKVVEDKTNTTTYYYSKIDEVSYFEQQDDSPILEDTHFLNLIEITNLVSSAMNYEVDIEFSIKNKIIYLLQVRPITTLKTTNKTILDNSNIVESYPGITLPLTYSFISDAYSGVFRNIIYRVLKNNKQTNEYNPIFKEMITCVNGRIYYKISNWYTLIVLLPFSSKTVPIWQDMMGVKDKEVNKKEFKNSILQNIKIYFNSLIEFINVPKNMKKLNTEFNSINTYFNDKYSKDLNNKQLVDLYHNLTSKVFDLWGVTLLNDGYAFVFTGLLKSRFKKISNNNYEELTNNYISRISNIESMKPIKELVRISNLVLEANQRTELLQLESDNDVETYLQSKGILQEELNIYIQLFGDRSLEELKLESNTFRSKPIYLVEKILEYTEDIDKLKLITDSLNTDLSDDIHNTVNNASQINKHIIRFLSKRAVLGINNREVSRLNRTRLYGMARSIFLSIANNLLVSHVIDDISDIFYLRKEEVFGFINGEDIDLGKIIKTKKKEFNLYNQLPMYTRLVFSGPERNKVHKNINSISMDYTLDNIIGTACSNGVVSGEVLVINDPTEATDIKDKILVTKMTDPGWVFLLTMAKGIIVEKGSLLSHTAIISRELGIPSIVGVTNATQILKTGDYVKMDGSSGIIERVDK